MSKRKYAFLFLIFSGFGLPDAHATLGLQDLADSLMAFTGFSPVWAPPVRVKNMRVNGNDVVLKTNGTLRDFRWTPDNIAELKRKVSLWTLGHEKGRITVYSNSADIESLVTACAKGGSAAGKQKDLTERNIVVYPSHGLYFNRDRKEWIWQRATLWTTVEDLYSQEYVRLIKRMLENAGADVLSPRAGIDCQAPGPSGMPQWTEGARYFLQAQEADSALWFLYDGDEYKDDMKCRAMWVNAQTTPIDLCLAFHTDGNDSGNDSTVIGTLAIYTAKDDDGHTTLRDGRDREKTNRNLADYIQTQVTQDLRHIAPQWTRRQLKEANYCESRVPVVPSLILELLSHKNMADMRYGLDPAFRFAAARAVYKGILRFLNGAAAVVQPLPVEELAIHTDGLLTWRPALDSIEPSAIPTYYLVYIRQNDGEWDIRQVEGATQFQTELKPGVHYNYYVVAANDGGLAFPSPVISAYLTSDSAAALVVDGFNDRYGPDWFADSAYAGIVPGSYACEDHFSCAYIGYQWNYTRTDNWRNDDNCGWGACYRDHAGQITVGNSHDWAVRHGRVLHRLQRSFVSCTAGMLTSMRNDERTLADYAFIDFICGRNKIPLDRTTENELSAFLSDGGRLLLSTDHFSAINPAWAKQFLHAAFYAPNATHSGRINTPHRPFRLFLEPNDEQLFTCHPEALKPENGAISMASYDDMRCSAAVGWNRKTLVYGFPLETVRDFENLYIYAIEWLLD